MPGTVLSAVQALTQLVLLLFPFFRYWNWGQRGYVTYHDEEASEGGGGRPWASPPRETRPGEEQRGG